MFKTQGLMGVPLGRFFKDLWKDISDDYVFDGAATLAFYWMLALFPAMIFLLSLLPYLPIENVNKAIMDFLMQALPKQSASLFSGVISEVTSHQSSGLLSFGALATIWASSTGMYAVMQQLNRTYQVKEARSYLKARLVATALTLVFGVVIIAAFSLIVFGGHLQTLLISFVGHQSAWLLFFKIFRWVIIIALLLSGFALLYYYGPNIKQDFRFITPGSVVGTTLLIGASLCFQYYVNNFSNYAATYGSIGAVIILMLWLYIDGVVILLGSEINALIEHYHNDGKIKSQQRRSNPVFS